MSVFGLLYTLAAYGLFILALQALALSLSYLWLRRRSEPHVAPPPEEWPTVALQLPIYNERYVVERLISAACAIDYPRDRLRIQVLDDSTDDTSLIAQACVEAQRARGQPISLLRRHHRNGYKAGALAEALAQGSQEFLAIFDADFLPPPDFLKRLIPVLRSNPSVGMVQARWAHLNADASLLTRAQAMALDGHFAVEQGARSQAGLLLNFNGSAGIWRRACITSAGGWQTDTLAEDLDLSCRAQLLGWRLLYLPEVAAPAEVPTTIQAFKRQQFRWAKGTIQVLRKLGGRILSSRLPLHVRLAAIVHLCGYLAHPFMLLLLLTSLPVMAWGELQHLPVGLLWFAGFGPPLLFAVSQWAIYPDWLRRLPNFLALVCVGGGLGLNNSLAVVEALLGRSSEFHRTPKGTDAQEVRSLGAHGGAYRLKPDWTTWGELALGVYGLCCVGVAFELAPGLMPFLGLYAISYLFVAGLTWWQGRDADAPRQGWVRRYRGLAGRTRSEIFDASSGI